MIVATFFTLGALATFLVALLPIQALLFIALKIPSETGIWITTVLILLSLLSPLLALIALSRSGNAPQLRASRKELPWLTLLFLVASGVIALFVLAEPHELGLFDETRQTGLLVLVSFIAVLIPSFRALWVLVSYVRKSGERLGVVVKTLWFCVPAYVGGILSLPVYVVGVIARRYLTPGAG